MNEGTVKKIVEFKLDMVDRILEVLPPQVSDEIKTLQKVVVETMAEQLKEREGTTKKQTPPKGDINEVPIE